MKLHQVLFDEIYAQGVRQIFGIPGDFVLNLYEALSQDGRFQLVTFSHEPAVGFAADGASRITNGLGVCVVTYGAGGLNLLNSIACAYAEESPLIVITGGPGKSEKRLGVQVHHEVKSYDSQFKIFQEVTEFGAVLDDPRTAVADIRKAIEVALKFKRPVYLEVPRDMVFADVSPLSSVEQVELRVDAGAVEEAAQEIVSRLRAAKNPVLIVGVEVHRFHLIPKVLELAERLQIPVTSSFLGRGVFPTRHPQFIGTYLGGVSPQPLREIVESSDCLLLIGELVSDTSLGVSADRVNEDNLIVCVAREVFIKYHQFQHTPIDMLVDRLLMSDLPVRGHIVEAMGTDVSAEIFDPFKQDEQIKMKHVIKLVNEFVEQHPEMPLVADTGDALFASVDIRSNECIAPAYYATMGFAVPAALGAQIASGRRPLGAGRRRRVSDDRQRDLARAQVPLQPDRRASQQQPMGDAAGVFSGCALQRDGRVAFLEARRAVGRPGIPRAHAPAVQGRARRVIRRGEALLADRGRPAARRYLADSSRVRARGEDAGACQIKRAKSREQRAEGKAQRAGGSCTCRPCCCWRLFRLSGHGRLRCTSATTFPGSAATTTAFSGTCGGCGRR